MLFVSDPSTHGGWGYIPDMTFHAGGELHAYDYPLFYRDIRRNAAERVSAFLVATSAGASTESVNTTEPETCTVDLHHELY